ncbi:VOC family protein [Cellulomonas sp. PhB143]|uniref:VOC family protein n=1 Tax=Cellulomonas sp. PhB143 TaxID=2485186 RepID=UPI000F48D052|nr:VOC family protein [Cellulomonas sp. PhB143]ROS75505.1 catechol 2,3-dioxygenase-like lactoylglutathione lyase family enzyme [Cellulomonas sp. PhB143]
MTTTQPAPGTTVATPPPAAAELRLEVVVVPVSDVAEATSFYADTLGWRLDADFTAADGLTVVQVTPPGSPAAVIFGTGITATAPGSIDGLLLAVHDVARAREELLARGVRVSEVFHDAGGVFHHSGGERRISGADPQGRSYSSWASFEDPDGNRWYLQEVRERQPGR